MMIPFHLRAFACAYLIALEAFVIYAGAKSLEANIGNVTMLSLLSTAEITLSLILGLLAGIAAIGKAPSIWPRNPR